LTDFIGRHILYQHYIQEALKDTKAINKAKSQRTGLKKELYRLNRGFVSVEGIDSDKLTVGKKVAALKERILEQEDIIAGRPKEAAAKAIEEFVNFDIPSHRMTEYANEIGLFWFTKYATRIPAIALKAIADKPVDSALAWLMSSHLGTDNIMESIIPNFANKIGTAPTSLVGSGDDLATYQLFTSILR